VKPEDILELMNLKDWTPADLAARLGISTRSIDRYLAKEAKPHRNTVRAFARILEQARRQRGAA
jgi:transcriptional regulator with XRE-family HTH domain